MTITRFKGVPRFFMSGLPVDINTIQTILRVEDGVLRRDPMRKPYPDTMTLPISVEALIEYRKLRDREIFSTFIPEAHMENYREATSGTFDEPEINIPYSLARDIHSVHFQKARLPEHALSGLEPLTVINMMVSVWNQEVRNATRSSLDALANLIVDETNPENMDLTIPRRRRGDKEISQEIVVLEVDRVKGLPNRTLTSLEEGVSGEDFVVVKEAVAAYITLISQHKLKPDVRGFAELYRRGLLPLTIMLADTACIQAMETLTGYSAEQLMESIAKVDASHSLLRRDSIETLLIAQELAAIERNERKQTFTSDIQAAQAAQELIEAQQRESAEQAAREARIAQAKIQENARAEKKNIADQKRRVALGESLDQVIERGESLEERAREYFESFRKVCGYKNGENFARYVYTRGLKRKFPELRSMLIDRIILANLENNLRHIVLLNKIATQFKSEGILDPRAISGLKQLMGVYEITTDEYFSAFNFKKMKEKDIMPPLDHRTEEMSHRGKIPSTGSAWANVFAAALEPNSDSIDLPIIEAGNQQTDVSPKIFGIPEMAVYLLRDSPNHWVGKLIHDVSGMRQPLPNGSALESASLTALDSFVEDFTIAGGDFPSFIGGYRAFELRKSRESLSPEDNIKLDEMLQKTGLGRYIGLEPFKSFRTRMQELP